MEFFLRMVSIGVGATVVLDLWVLFATRVLGISGPDWAMVGRWIGHLPRGRFRHVSMAAALPVRGERLLGWSTHYAIGIAFAGFLLAIWGLDWARQPTLLPALIVGVLTVAAPFFILQPGMGAGIAASKTPKPNAARLRSLVSHTVFGIGLYVSTLLVAMVPF
ncbi:DUF2938 domain-containing protein [Parvibaculum sp.]|nr:DUF2938 domain-containing protein [Parvibaculum sp.]MDP1625744.1 DUF2938 domain-containing protein [Parvibaculum sp.]MDP2149107.1 DUF2938 domain-containing protein [Parvibaculum sp.]MDP3328354.1 DUF2938 domain-containing protein [Parvibaculum sp.]